jgi:segregation and condensation protein B
MEARKPRLARTGDDAEGRPDAPAPQEGSGGEVVEEEVGLSLEELGQTYAQLLGQGAVPYQSPEEASPEPSETTVDFDPIADELIENDQCPITPLSILEAILFVGRPDSAPIEADLIAGMMRGVRSAEIQQLVDELNEIYASEGHVLRIVASGEGFRMQLAEEFAAIGDRFYGSVREIKLTQAAIDCLAIIAYRPGITREEVEQQRGQPSGGILNQLVRRQLVEIRREEIRREDGKKERLRRYFPTQRMLKLAGIDSLDELPLAEDFER